MSRALVCVTLILSFWYVMQSGDSSASVPVSPLTTAATVPTFVRSTPPVLDARAYLVMDMNTGEILYSQNPDELLPIASITKLVTAATVVQLQPHATPVIISDVDVATEGRFGKLVAGQEYTAYETLFPLLIESANDAGTALARTYGAQWETTTAAVLASAGVTDAMQIADATGLSDRNRASATAVATFTRHLYTTNPHLLDITQLPNYVGKYTGLVNNSPVITKTGYRGGKHGYTDAAGKTLTAVFTESFRTGDRPIIYVILGTDDLESAVAVLRESVATMGIQDVPLSGILQAYE